MSAPQHQLAVTGVEPNQEWCSHVGQSSRPRATLESSGRYDLVTTSGTRPGRSRPVRHRAVTAPPQVAWSAPARASMRVLYCTDTYPPQINGVSIVTALSVAGLIRRGWECAVVGPRYPAATHALWDGEAGAEPPPGDGDEPAQRVPARLPRAQARGPRPGPGASADPALPAGPGPLRDGVHRSVGWGSEPRRRPACRSVSSYHTDFGRYAEAYGAPWLRRAVTAYLTRFHRRSRAGLHAVERDPPELVDRDLPDVEVWGRGVDTTTFHPRPPEPGSSATTLGMGSRFTFLYVGRLAPEKRVDFVMEAFRQASATVPRGVMHLDRRGDRAVRGRAQGGRAARRHLPRLSRSPHAACPTSTPTATRSRSRR